MEKILAHRAKFSAAVSGEQDTIEKFHTLTKESNEVNLKNSEIIANQNKIIQDLKKTVSYEKDKSAVEQQKVVCLANELENQLDVMEELMDELETLRLENNKYEVKIKTLKRIKPNPKDEQLLKLERFRLKYYKNLTGVVWNEQVIDDSTSGFITDWQEYIQSFSLGKNEKKIEAKLWAEILKCSENSKSPNNN
ncbi:GSCOCG00009146001-RA-CDS [Cotesia congregata]|nr:GSCOCG00009146001-RA-CDS [Cotesia congregata]